MRRPATPLAINMDVNGGVAGNGGDNPMGSRQLTVQMSTFFGAGARRSKPAREEFCMLSRRTVDNYHIRRLPMNTFLIPNSSACNHLYQGNNGSSS